MSSGSNNETKTTEGGDAVDTVDQKQDINCLLIGGLVLGAVAVWWFFIRGKK